ncbi:hypothetical protein PybrP1_001519 [[Pythium] brassicae (nom. inval.)]|nr:hypothetical protein PybrP1_001519 [[Pythium] brassicae (nom. inval.)]
MAATTVAATATDLVAYVNTLLELSVELPVESKKVDAGAAVAAVAPLAEKLLAHDAETDVEGAFRLLFDLVRVLPTAAAAKEARALLAVVLGKADEKAVLRLRIASTLFNKSAALPDVRFDVLVKVIAFASATGNTDLVASYFDDVEALFAATALSAEQRRALYVAIADALQAADAEAGKSLKVVQFLEKYLATFTADAADIASGKAVAVRATTLVLQHPVASFVARVDLLSSPVVTTTLKGDQLLELLEIVSTKTLGEFAAFRASAGAAFFEAHALRADELEATLRLFTLCSLPAGFAEIPYATVAAALAIEEDAVEQWIVKAITSGLVSAKVDQLKRTVVISRTLQRSFGAAQWQDVHAKLQLYQKNVASVLEVVRSARRAHQQK